MAFKLILLLLSFVSLYATGGAGTGAGVADQTCDMVLVKPTVNFTASMTSSAKIGL